MLLDQGAVHKNVDWIWVVKLIVEEIVLFIYGWLIT